MELKDYIYNIESVDEKGESLKDVTAVFENGNALKLCVKQMTKIAKKLKPTIIVSPESKGFILGASVASKLGLGLVPARSPKNLSREYVEEKYLTHNGDSKELAIHDDAISKGDRVVIIDDKLSTGMTLKTTANLIERLGGNVVGIITLLELTDLNGIEKIKNYNVYSLVKDTLENN